MSFVTAFKEIRLTNVSTKVSGDFRLQVGEELVVYQSDTGNFVTVAYGDQRYVLATGDGYISGEKVFLNSPLVPTPTVASGAVNLGLLEQASGYLQNLISAASAGVSSLNGLSGVIDLVGQGNISITTGAGQIFIIGDTGQIASLSGDLLSTGNSLNSRLLQSGADLLSRNQTLSGNVVSLSGDLLATGAGLLSRNQELSGRVQSLSGDLLATGADLLSRIQQLSGNVTSLSGDLLNTGQTLLNLINTFSGNSQEFVTMIPTGIETYFIQFPQNFVSIPKVVATVEVTGMVAYFMAIANRTVSGYDAWFSDIISESGVFVNTFAKINGIP